MAKKKEKPISQVAKDLGLNENVLRRWITQTREAEGTKVRVFLGHGRPRYAELVRLRKEVKSLKEANEILKKRRSSSQRANPSNGVSGHESKPEPI